MKSRELGTLLFGLIGLYTLLLAVLGLAQLLPQAASAGAVVGGQLRLQATFVNGLTSGLLHLIFGIVLFAGRRRLAERLLGAEEEPARRPAAPGAAALAIAAAGVCAVAVLLLARFVTALAYALSLAIMRQNTGDIAIWTIGGIAVDLLLAAAGVFLIVQRQRVANLLLLAPPVGADDSDGAGGAGGAEMVPWQLAGLRFVGLALVVWHLPALASALSVFLKWWLRPVGFDLRSQALYDLPPAATGVLAGLYFFLFFPAGLRGAWRRVRY